MIPTYIAYRLPFSNATQFLLGTGKWIDKISNCSNNSIILHSFSGQQILDISVLKTISELDFKTFVIPETDTEQTKADYTESFLRLKKEIAKGTFKKVILSRTKKIATQKSALLILKELNANYKNTFNYVISNSEIGTWIGATPESLLSVEEKSFKTMSLAGTKMPSDKWTPKEYEEQQLVTDSILDRLKQENCTAINTTGPDTLKAGKVEHLHTKIEAHFQKEAQWKNLLTALHPTPAVCGIPTSEAKIFIPQLEKHNRHFYTGFIGIITPNKKDFFVNLRCMQYYNNTAKLYLGGGITAPSELEAEWEETERKSKTLAGII